MSVIAIIVFGLFLIGCVGILVFWFIAMYHFIAMVANKRPEAERKWWSAGFMTIYIPSALTDVGRTHRRRGFLFLAGSSVSFAIAGAAWLSMRLIGTNPP
jgi:hypothetical protein